MNPMKDEAVKLYKAGLDLREVGDTLGRSHEWVRKTLREAGEPLRERGRVPKERSVCPACGQPASTAQSIYCSQLCRQRYEEERVRKRLHEALRWVNNGASIAQAAKVLGVTPMLLHTQFRQYGYMTDEELEQRKRLS